MSGNERGEGAHLLQAHRVRLAPVIARSKADAVSSTHYLHQKYSSEVSGAKGDLDDESAEKGEESAGGTHELVHRRSDHVLSDDDGSRNTKDGTVPRLSVFISDLCTETGARERRESKFVGRRGFRGCPSERKGPSDGGRLSASVLAGDDRARQRTLGSSF